MEDRLFLMILIAKIAQIVTIENNEGMNIEGSKSSLAVDDSNSISKSMIKESSFSAQSVILTIIFPRWG